MKVYQVSKRSPADLQRGAEVLLRLISTPNLVFATPELAMRHVERVAGAGEQSWTRYVEVGSAPIWHVRIGAATYVVTACDVAGTDTVETEHGPVPKPVWDTLSGLFYAAEKACLHGVSPDDMNALGHAVDAAGKIVLGTGDAGGALDAADSVRRERVAAAERRLADATSDTVSTAG